MPRYNIADEEIARLFTVEHLTYRQIAAQIGMSPTMVGKRLRRVGVSASQGEHVKLCCAHCGIEIDRHRSRVRKASKLFCNKECYFATRENPAFVKWRDGGRVARAVVARYFELEPDHVVHHHDGNPGNNEPRNLAVLAREHSKYHHRAAGSILWDGRKLQIQ